MDRITKGYMNNFAASQELTGQNESELFELFACYCVLSKEYPEHFDISDIVTGGGSDAGIDGIAIIANNVLIHSQEEFDDLAEQTHTITDLKFIFIQAKTSPTFNGGDIATFGFGVCDLLKEQPELVQNAEVQEKSNIISHILSNMMRVRNKPKCLLYYVTTGNWTEDQNLCSRIEGVKSDLKSENLFSSMFLDKPQLASRYYGRLLKDSKDSGEIFNTNHQFIAYYVSAYALYRIEFLIRNKQIDQQYNKYGLYYDYDSSFEHGLWGAIRESSLLKCDNPAHKYHCVPDVEDEIRLKTVLPDCIMIMNKTVSFLNEIYGIPQQMLNGVINFELKPIDNQD